MFLMVAPCVLVILNPLFFQLMRTKITLKIVELLNALKTTINAPKCSIVHSVLYTRTRGLDKLCSHSKENSINPLAPDIFF